MADEPIPAMHTHEAARRGLDMTITLSAGGTVRLIGRNLTPAEVREVLHIVEVSLGEV
jgi:hypothetical protein